jgi:branched-chain amino acid transport system ATP-binding protein
VSADSDSGVAAEAATDPAATSGAESAEAVLRGDDLAVSYGEVAALRGVDFHVREGEIAAIIGPNGAGKSTLADAVAGHLPYEGSVTYRGREVSESRSSDLVSRGLIHCTETRDLFGHMSVADNLDLGAYRHRDAVGDRREFAYDLFPALAERTDQEARTMSGGEQQMLAIGRALMGDPDLLLLDEPTLGLAPVVLEDISDGIERIREEGVTVVLCEQNVTFAMEHADRVYLLENGRIEREGRPEKLRGDEYIREAYLGG